jgi:PilZ domain-containing protein
MNSEKRRSSRHNITEPGWVDVGDKARFKRCELIDISDTGARLFVEDIEDIPDSFSLHLSGYGIRCHLCNVVWRRDNSIGVEFLVAEPTLEGDVLDSEAMWQNGLAVLCSQWYEFGAPTGRAMVVLANLMKAALGIAKLQKAFALFANRRRQLSFPL